MAFKGFYIGPEAMPFKEPDCYCITCDEDFHHLGIMSHRAAHRRRHENCRIQFSDGRTVSYDFAKKVITND